MPDNLKRRGPEDPTKINVNQPYEVEYWKTILGISHESDDVLKRAVRTVGPLVKDVREWLHKNSYT